jgi:hypothetical protein
MMLGKGSSIRRIGVGLKVSNRGLPSYGAVPAALLPVISAARRRMQHREQA